MCIYLVQEWRTAPCDMEVWAAQIMGRVCLIDLFRTLYFVRNVARCRDRVEDIRAHFLRFIPYLLDQ